MGADRMQLFKSSPLLVTPEHPECQPDPPSTSDAHCSPREIISGPRSPDVAGILAWSMSFTPTTTAIAACSRVFGLLCVGPCSALPALATLLRSRAGPAKQQAEKRLRFTGAGAARELLPVPGGVARGAQRAFCGRAAPAAGPRRVKAIAEAGGAMNAAGGGAGASLRPRAGPAGTLILIRRLPPSAAPAPRPRRHKARRARAPAAGSGAGVSAGMRDLPPGRGGAASARAPGPRSAGAAPQLRVPGGTRAGSCARHTPGSSQTRARVPGVGVGSCAGRTRVLQARRSGARWAPAPEALRSAQCALLAPRNKEMVKEGARTAFAVTAATVLQ
ncbi:atherin-like [Onychostruthus taczanowskii]|uniref:atherin-like n=1 Tax=Onychostruthus taczanowskii TaxID=356909 RepID=UPI001B80CC85|nr:atherin-like [Onychostruthus taczanowskii]